MIERSDDKILIVMGLQNPLPTPAAILAEDGVELASGVASRRFSAQAPHTAACSCCRGRSAAAAALAALVLARARGEVAWFATIHVVPRGWEGRAAVLRALAEDPLLRARCRLADPGG
jgi:hypothetical protein